MCGSFSLPFFFSLSSSSLSVPGARFTTMILFLRKFTLTKDEKFCFLKIFLFYATEIHSLFALYYAIKVSVYASKNVLTLVWCVFNKTEIFLKLISCNRKLIRFFDFWTYWLIFQMHFRRFFVFDLHNIL